MRVQFYHAIALGALLTASCGGATPTPAGAPPPTSTAASGAPVTRPGTDAAPTNTPASDTASPTAAAIARGREIIELVRTAAGGAKLTAMRGVRATGTSSMSVVAGDRALSVRALFPGFYRQEEIPAAKGGLGVAIGVQGEGLGWMLGARLGGAGLSKDPAVMQATYNRAGNQALVGFLAGVSAPWLVDTTQYTPVSAGLVDAGDDRGLYIVSLEGPLGRAGQLLVDPGTNLPRRFIEPPQPNAGGEAGRNPIEFTYSDFKAVYGVELPHTIVRRVGPIVTTWHIDQYEINPRLQPRDFTQRTASKAR